MSHGHGQFIPLGADDMLGRSQRRVEMVVNVLKAAMSQPSGVRNISHFDRPCFANLRTVLRLGGLLLIQIGSNGNVDRHSKNDDEPVETRSDHG